MKRTKKKKDERGFTLVELLIVVSVIAVLAAIAISLFPPYRARSTRGGMLSDARNVATSLEAYYAEGATYLPADGETVTGPSAFAPGTPLEGLRMTKGSTVLIQSTTAAYTIAVTNSKGNASGFIGPLLLINDGSCRWTSGQNC